MNTLIKLFFAVTTAVLASSDFAMASSNLTEWHAKCSIGTNPAKEITVKVGESATVLETAEYTYSVELREKSLTLRGDAVKEPMDKGDTVVYTFIEFENELPRTVVLTSRVTHVFLCEELR